jgi:hypothetical protein
VLVVVEVVVVGVGLVSSPRTTVIVPMIASAIMIVAPAPIEMRTTGLRCQGTCGSAGCCS